MKKHIHFNASWQWEQLFILIYFRKTLIAVANFQNARVVKEKLMICASMTDSTRHPFAIYSNVYMQAGHALCRSIIVVCFFLRISTATAIVVPSQRASVLRYALLTGGVALKLGIRRNARHFPTEWWRSWYIIIIFII